MHYSIQQLPAEDRPRERLARYGVESLSAIELLAVLLGSGSKTKPVLQLAHEMIMQFGGIPQLADATLAELLAVKGIGLAKAIQIKAAFHLGARASKKAVSVKHRIEHPSHAYYLLKEEIENEKRELFIVILQDIKGYVICHEVVSIGSLSQTIVHPREVFYLAIRHKAATIIIAHNHPSGDPTPSAQDILVTQNLIEAGKLMNIPVNDHLIIGQQRYISLRQNGLVNF